MAKKISEIIKRTVKHRATIAPFECEHCGFIWYGTGCNHVALPGHDLCSKCHNALYTMLWCKYDGDWYAERFGKAIRKEVCEDAMIWVQDKTNYPHIRPENKKYHHSVPKWMRNAIDTEAVKTNGHEIYTIWSVDDKVEKIGIRHGKEA